MTTAGSNESEILTDLRDWLSVPQTNKLIGFDGRPNAKMVDARNKESFEIEKTILGGRSGSEVYVFNAEVIPRENLPPRGILKLIQQNSWRIRDEGEKHRDAWRGAPSTFLKSMAEMYYEPLKFGPPNRMGLALFYKIAGDNLEEYRSPTQLDEDSRRVLGVVSSNLLTNWNDAYHHGSVKPSYKSPQGLLADWLQPKGLPLYNVSSFLLRWCDFDDDEKLWFHFGGIGYPNPLCYCLNPTSWGNHNNTVKTFTGFLHGDLHPDNILYRGDDVKIIDFAYYRENRPLFFDHAYLELAYALREDIFQDEKRVDNWLKLANDLCDEDKRRMQTDAERRASEEKRTDLAKQISTIRSEIDNWIVEINGTKLGWQGPMIQQFRLARVAAGLDFCNKRMKNERRFLAFMWAAIHLKQYLSYLDIHGAPSGLQLKAISSPQEKTRGLDQALDNYERPETEETILRSIDWGKRLEKKTIAREVPPNS